MPKTIDSKYYILDNKEREKYNKTVREDSGKDWSYYKDKPLAEYPPEQKAMWECFTDYFNNQEIEEIMKDKSVSFGNIQQKQYELKKLVKYEYYLRDLRIFGEIVRLYRHINDNKVPVLRVYSFVAEKYGVSITRLRIIIIKQEGVYNRTRIRNKMKAVFFQEASGSYFNKYLKEKINYFTKAILELREQNERI